MTLKFRMTIFIKKSNWTQEAVKSRFVHLRPQKKFCGCGQKIDYFIQNFTLIFKIFERKEVATKVIKMAFSPGIEPGTLR